MRTAGTGSGNTSSGGSWSTPLTGSSCAKGASNRFRRGRTAFTAARSSPASGSPAEIPEDVVPMERVPLRGTAQSLAKVGLAVTQPNLAIRTGLRQALLVPPRRVPAFRRKNQAFARIMAIHQLDQAHAGCVAVEV